MQHPWWKHFAWIHLYAILGAVVGALMVGIGNRVFTSILVEFLSAQAGMQNVESGLSGIFFGIWMVIYILVLGGMSGYFITHLRGKYRAKFAPIGLMITGLASLVFAIAFASVTLSLMGARATVANYSSCFVYSLILVIGGAWMLRDKSTFSP